MQIPIAVNYFKCVQGVSGIGLVIDIASKRELIFCIFIFCYEFSIIELDTLFYLPSEDGFQTPGDLIIAASPPNVFP